jgi:ketosteroid isomerase-like protein
MTTQPTIIQVLTDYYAAFNTLDVHAFLPFFHEPCLLFGPAMFAAPTHAVQATAFVTPISDLRSRGFGRSELSVQLTKTLSETAGLVSGVAIRYKADGHELERVGVTYIMHKNATGWKIAVLVLHDADNNKAA